MKADPGEVTQEQLIAALAAQMVGKHKLGITLMRAAELAGVKWQRSGARTESGYVHTFHYVDESDALRPSKPKLTLVKS